MDTRPKTAPCLLSEREYGFLRSADFVPTAMSESKEAIMSSTILLDRGSRRTAKRSRLMRSSRSMRSASRDIPEAPVRFGSEEVNLHKRLGGDNAVSAGLPENDASVRCCFA